MQLVLLNFNNYSNRRLKKYDDISDYYENASEYDIIDDYDFNPADGVDTSVVLGGEYYDIDSVYDYLLVTEDNSIISRWYIIDCNRTRTGQYTVNLHRDVLADNWSVIIEAPAYIEKAILPDTNPLVYNEENANFNQIKTSAETLTDETKCGWIVGYCDRKDENSVYGQEITIKANTIPDVSVTNLSYWSYYNYINELVYGENINSVKWMIKWTTNGVNYTVNTFDRVITGAFGPYGIIDWNHLDELCADSLSPSSKARFSPSVYIGIASQENQVIAVTSVSPADTYKVTVNYGVNNLWYSGSSALKSYLSSVGLPAGSASVSIKPYDEMPYSGYGPGEQMKSMVMNLNQVVNATHKITFPTETNRLNLKDAPYDMFCIPYGDLTLKNTKTVGSDSPWSASITKSLAMSFAQGIAAKLGSLLFDLQLLPYCPLTGMVLSTNSININTTDSKRCTLIKNEDKTAVEGAIIWCTSSTINKTITKTIGNTNRKMQSQTEMYRLVSPNYSGTFEFNASKNNGVTRFQISCTYLPYNPYIRVNPVFGGLYGQNFNQDIRGLVCQGDFSICYLSDKWAEYQIQNKNYQEAFNRETQSMDYKHKWERASNITNAVTGTLTGAAGGAMVGNGVGAAVGAVLSAGAGALDVYASEKLYNENMDYRQDMFAFNNENIQALPNAISHMTAYNTDNQIFPILEYYTCTDEEKRAFANKIAWNSMTVDTIGKIKDYIGNSWKYSPAVGEPVTDKGYIKCRIIRFDGLREDYHMANTINNELGMGVYTK